MDASTILLSSDHAGFAIKDLMRKELERTGHTVHDLGTDSAETPKDYPRMGAQLAQLIQQGAANKGILVCGTGIGISIAANRFSGIRAAVCTSPEMATLSVQHNNANVLVLGGRTTSPENAVAIMRAWLSASFEGGRHARRVELLDAPCPLPHTDPEVFRIIQQEEIRQNQHLEMIASENFVSRAVLQAAGSVLTNKYAEGYPGKRYYGGCVHVDAVESLAQERAKKLFSAGYVNVQPHSGSQANMAVYLGLLNPHDTVMGLDLSHGGHLTHGSRVNFSGRLFNIVSYGVSPVTGQIDYDVLRKLALEHRPRMIIAGGSAYPRTLHFDRFREICDEIGAYLMCDIAHIAGLVAAGLHPSPMTSAHAVTTTTHKTLRGPRGGMILSNSEEVAKAFNKNIFPGIQGGPLMHIIAAKAVAFKEALDPSFAEYQKQILKNARTLSECLLLEGFTLVSGGTDTHLMLLDLRNKNITGKDAEEALDAAGITVNKNSVPFDTQKPTVTSGIRIGTPAQTTRGMKENEMRNIAKWITRVIQNPTDPAVLSTVRQQVLEMCSQFPLP